MIRSSSRGVTRRYGEGEAAIDALRGVSVRIAAGMFTAVVGPSGSGKSTLMHILAGLDKPTDGDGEVAGTTVVVLITLLALLVLAGACALCFRSPVDPLYLALAVLAACLAPIATVLQRDALRNTSILLVLVPFVRATSWDTRPGGRARA
jgi:ABC-type glutathione transport system ATPase component